MRLTLSALAVLWIASVGAFPFGKDSGVAELTPQTLPGFLDTHKAVFVMFYAPWCGHCKALHPDWAKFGKGMNEVVRVGAVNADTHKELASQFGIQGFPTIKYWGMGPKKGKKPQDYQGQRSAGALQSAALAEVKGDVATAATEADLRKLVGTLGKAVVLVSAKPKAAPLFNVLSQSPQLKAAARFVLVSEKSTELMALLGVAKAPSIVVVSAGEDPHGPLRTAKYDGAIEYTPIAKFLKSALGGAATAEEGSGDPAPKAAGPAGAKPAEAKEEPAKKADTPKKAPRPSIPVRPMELTPELFATFCSASAPRIREQQPFCVIALGERSDLTELHAEFEREAVLFFWVPEKAAAKAAEQLSVLTALTPSDVLIVRGGKDRTKFVVWRANSEECLSRLIERVAGGEATLSRSQSFPTLSF